MNTSEYLTSSSRDYAIYVCKNRAIPAIQDGLKHGQRIALWLLRDRDEKLKTFALSGLMGYSRLYVHGETSANNAISLLAAPYKNNVCLIEGHGQFGNRVAPDKDGIGAPRYTEVRRAKSAEAILYPDLDLVEKMDNYDGSNQEPVSFLPLIPTVLLNGVEGVAIGWSTDILPRSLSGLIQATVDALNGEKRIRGLEPHFARYNVGVKSLEGNKYEFSGRAEIVDSSTVLINELPPGLSVEKFRKRLIQMEEEDLIASFADRSTETIEVHVKFKRGSIKGWTEDAALEFFKLREKASERIVVLAWNGTSIATYDDPATLVREFAAWRLGWYTKRYEKMVADASYELLYWLGLHALFETPTFLTKIGKFKDKADMEAAINTVFKKWEIVLDDKQFDRILNLQTYRWTKAYAEEVSKRIAELDTEINADTAILNSPDKLKDIYVAELNALKKLKV
jgi:DNA gyrase/topoisomerase IV subunit A